jgi:uncharacterized protein
VKADPFAQLKLLDIQEIDSRILQLRHRLANLAETAEIEKLQAGRKQLDDQARDARITRDDLLAAQKKAESDVEAVRTRRDREQQRVDQGAVTHAKDLERLQAEIANITRRIGVLEDEELEVMERLEAATVTVDEREKQLADLDAQLHQLTTARAQRASGLEEELAQVSAERGPAVEGMPADLMALYDRIREQKGSGAAELRRRECGGCMLTLDAAEIIAIRGTPSDQVVRHEECGRILIRTSESGL